MDVVVVYLGSRNEYLLDDERQNIFVARIDLHDEHFHVFLQEHLNEMIELLLHFSVLPQLSQVLVHNALENEDAQICETFVFVEITNSKVDELAFDTSSQHYHEYFQELVELRIDVRFYFPLFWVKAVVEYHIIFHYCLSFFEYDETVDVPSIESDAVRGVVEQICQELENQFH